METYPSKFIKEVIQEYGKDSDVAEAALFGSFNLGNLLSQGINIDFSPAEVIQLLEENKAEEVLHKAKSCINRRRLHKMWLSIMMDRIKQIEQQTTQEIQTVHISDEAPPSKRSVNPSFLSLHS